MFSLLYFVFLIPLLTSASEDIRYFQSIYNSVKSLESRQSFYEVEKACYPDIGCFQTDGLLKHIGILPTAPEKIKTKFYAYTHTGMNTSLEVNPHDTTTFSVIPQSKPLVIIIHGFNNNHESHELVIIKNSLIKYANIETVIVVDWAAGAKEPWYTEAALNTEVVGRQVAFLVETLRTNHSVDPKNVHLIGFSLGAHVSGFAGKFSQSQYKWKFGRISALDSAAPLFEGYPGSYLDFNDAIFVDALHTSAGNNLLRGEIGFIKPFGHVDFYPHGGKQQPRCKGQLLHLSCNHESSPLYFEASLSGTGKQCTAYKCADWTDFEANKCTKNGDSRMGYFSIGQPGTGAHYLAVAHDYPFCEN